jgi:hypothetical protein
VREAHAILIFHLFTQYCQYLATWSINILTFMTTFMFYFFLSHSTFSRDLANMWNPSNWFRICVSENSSGFCPITIPMDLISVFEKCLSPQGSIELPWLLNLLPCQGKIVAVYSGFTMTWGKEGDWIKVHFSLIYRTTSAKNTFKSRTLRLPRGSYKTNCAKSKVWLSRISVLML